MNTCTSFLKMFKKYKTLFDVGCAVIQNSGTYFLYFWIDCYHKIMFRTVDGVVNFTRASKIKNNTHQVDSRVKFNLPFKELWYQIKLRRMFGI